MRAIFTYHSLDDSGSAISMSAAAFRGHVDWFGSGVVRVVALDELLQGDADEDCVAITFDDGFANFSTEAAPLVAELGLPVTVFVVTDHVGRTNAWQGRSTGNIPVLDLMDWPALGALAEAGVTIASHTRTHPRLDGLAPTRLTDEIEASAEIITREIGRSPEWFAYPYGLLDAPAASAVAKRYRGAVTTDYRPLGRDEDPVRLPRLDAYYFRTPGGLRAWATPGFRSGLWLRRQARRARAVFAPGPDSTVGHPASVVA